jgi:hypothetical protein
LKNAAIDDGHDCVRNFYFVFIPLHQHLAFVTQPKRLLVAAVITVITTPKDTRGEFKKRPNFLNSTPTSTESALG